MLATTHTLPRPSAKTRFERLLSIVTDVRAGEGATAMLMLVNVFLLLVAYSVIKTVREPLILLGGGAEVRSYAAAGQALLLMAYVPAYSWVASRVDRMRLVVGVSLFFVTCIELFAGAVTAGVSYVGVAFFIWVGIFNISLVAQFWSFANDLYSKEDGVRLFPVVMIGMTAGAPLGSLVAARLFRLGLPPQAILQIPAVLLAISVLLYQLVNTRETLRAGRSAETLAPSGGFGLVLGNPYLRLVAALVVLLNVVNTTGEYMVARLLTAHVNELAAATAGFDKRAYIGAFSGDYQFWVNVTAFLLQAFVTSRLVKFRGLAGILMVLPLIALGGYSLIAAGAGLSVVRWIKTAENATDYSIMNTARQMLWLPTTREEKYKAKQAIDTFCVRAGDVLSALAVFVGAKLLHLEPNQLAVGNIALTVLWLGVAVLILRPALASRPLPMGALVRVAATVAALVAVATPLAAQDTREDALAAQRAEKAAQLRPYEPNAIERRIQLVNSLLVSNRPVYPFIGNVIEGGGVAFGPGYRRRLGADGSIGAHAAWSFTSFGAAAARVSFPSVGGGAVRVEAYGEQLHAPSMPFYGVGSDSPKDNLGEFAYDRSTVGTSLRVRTRTPLAVGASAEWLVNRTDGGRLTAPRGPVDVTYRRTSAFAELDWRSSPGYTRRGGLVRADWSDYRADGHSRASFQRMDIGVQQFVPLFRENWVIALRGETSLTQTQSGHQIPYFMLPELGGSHALRGFSPWRFRDRNRVLFSGEYRWTAGELVDMAIFVDAGTVAARPERLNLGRLHTSHGIGMRLHTPSATFTRIELARSREGLSLIFSFSPSF